MQGQYNAGTVQCRDSVIQFSDSTGTGQCSTRIVQYRQVQAGTGQYHTGTVQEIQERDRTVQKQDRKETFYFKLRLYHLSCIMSIELHYLTLPNVFVV
jgi:hypothetical protein